VERDDCDHGERADAVECRSVMEAAGPIGIVVSGHG
jgi:hypothetical protein